MNKIYILGAGASAHAGAPLGNNIIEKYIELKLKQIEKERKISSEHGRESYIAPILGNFRTLNYILRIQPNCKFTHETSLEDLKKENLPNIEDVLTLYDIAYQKDEPLLFESDIDLNIIRKEILYLLTYTLEYSTIGALNENNTTLIYQAFVEKLTKEDTIITYNYDTLLDNAILHKFNELNYGFDFLTEEGTINPLPEEQRIKLLENIAEEEGILIEEVKEKYFVPKEESELKFGVNSPLLIKPHGSLNWLYCPKCYRFFCLTRKELMNKTTDNGFYLDECVDYCKGNLQQFIVPLTHHKSFQNPLLNNMWMKINQRLSTAEEVYFIGYSIPDADYTSKYYYIKGLTRPNRRDCAVINLINPNAEEKGLSVKYKKIFGDITEIIDDHKFEEVEMNIGDKTFKTPQIKEFRYKFGKKKFNIIEQTFEDWVNESQEGTERDSQR